MQEVTTILIRKVASIKNRRRKAGALQYNVVYEGDKNEKGHWIAVEDLDCQDLINQYESSHPSRSPQPAPTRRVKEILGMCRDRKEPAFVVRFVDSIKPELATTAYMHKHCVKLLLSYYETNMHFIHTEENEQPRAPVQSPPVASAPVKLTPPPPPQPPVQANPPITEAPPPIQQAISKPVVPSASPPVAAQAPPPPPPASEEKHIEEPISVPEQPVENVQAEQTQEQAVADLPPTEPVETQTVVEQVQETIEPVQEPVQEVQPTEPVIEQTPEQVQETIETNQTETPAAEMQ